MRSGFDTLSWITVLLVLAIRAVANPIAPTTLPAGIIAVSPPRAAPALVLSDDSGKPYNLNNSRGKWVFVHFWASWCGPCKREMPSISLLKELFANPQLHLVLINTAETEDTIFSFLGATAPTLTTLMDADGQVTEIWSPRGLPATFLVDPHGQIRYMALGGRPWDTAEYQSFLKSLLREK